MCAMLASVFAKHPFKCLIYGVDSLKTMSLVEDSSGRSVEVDGVETVRANLPTISTPRQNNMIEGSGAS
jgi:hypothetical protein